MVLHDAVPKNVIKPEKTEKNTQWNPARSKRAGKNGFSS